MGNAPRAESRNLNGTRGKIGDVAQKNALRNSKRILSIMDGQTSETKF